MEMKGREKNTNDVPLAPNARQGVVAKVLPRAEARALAPRSRSGRLGTLMKEKSQKRRISNPSETNWRNLP
jgi:hypothetical protein